MKAENNANQIMDRFFPMEYKTYDGTAYDLEASPRYRKLQKIIGDLGISASRFAVNCGMDFAYFRKMLANGCDFTVEQMDTMAYKLGCNNPEGIEELFFEEIEEVAG